MSALPDVAFDVAVIGGGPAGAAAALAAARAGHTVALFEPCSQPDKPCGEGILPSGVAVLRALGLAELLAHGQPLERIGYVLPSGRELEIPFAHPGCALERPVLAAALAQALAREARVTRFARHVSSTRSGREFRLQSGTETWRARTLIAADGLRGQAAGWLRDRRAGPRHGSGRYGLRARALARRPLERVEVHLGRESELYLTPLANGRVNVAVLRDELPPGERASSAWLAAALREHPRAAQTLGAWITAPEARALAHARPRRTAEAGAFLAGDASGGIDPVLGCGVALALATGLAAAHAAGRVLAHGSGAGEREYRRFVRRETRVRAALAGGLTYLAGRPALQEAVVRGLGAWPRASARLAALVAGS